MSEPEVSSRVFLSIEFKSRYYEASAHTTICLHANCFATYLLHILVAMCDIVQSGMAIFLRVQHACALLIANALLELHTAGILTKHNTS